MSLARTFTSDEIWMPSAAIRRIFKVADKTLHDRGVRHREGDNRLEFDLADFWIKCADLVFKKHGAEASIGGDDMKAEKLAEEVRKLRIANDESEGLLVRADEVEQVYSRGIKAMADELDSVASRVKMTLPNVDQSVLAVVSDILSEARRKAARVEFGNGGNL